ncbi:duf6 domain [Moniliophthora roreri MCA 2997]|uniref:Duf6 domain n=2 Tax=Moniliophthora roreri TaxID=221103 RepID=V2X1K3_MONRO|nr:duf6 domain [Moniliophthora roreri MCA 2997]KAI3622464.1 duf6 domain [Moniliophthora roreri]
MFSLLTRLDAKWTAPAIFIVTLFAFVAESQLTQYVQTTLQYKQPYFLFYIVHSSFLISYPCHLLYLVSTTSHTPYQLWRSVKVATANRLVQDSNPTDFPVAEFVYLVLALTTGLTIPSLLWFVAIAISSVTDVTAIWNTNAFFAYIFSVKVFGLKWEARRLGAVVLATIGVIAVVYGGSSGGSPEEASTLSTTPKSVTPLAGDLLTLFGSMGYGAYQVFYKKYAALASDPDPEGLDGDYERLPTNGDLENDRQDRDAVGVEIPPPFGLHSNFLVTCIGLCTLGLLWVPIPLLHWSGAEPFALPPNWSTVGAISGIALTGSMFNAGFMILLGLWGPIITSVGGLLTIVLIFISDVLLGATEALTAWSVLGSATIIAAFGVLAYDVVRRD